MQTINILMVTVVGCCTMATAKRTLLQFTPASTSDDTDSRADQVSCDFQQSMCNWTNQQPAYPQWTRAGNSGSNVIARLNLAGYAGYTTRRLVTPWLEPVPNHLCRLDFIYFAGNVNYCRLSVILKFSRGSEFQIFDSTRLPSLNATFSNETQVWVGCGEERYQIVLQGQQLTSLGYFCHPQFNEIDVDSIVYNIIPPTTTTTPQPSSPPPTPSPTTPPPPTSSSSPSPTTTATTITTTETLVLPPESSGTTTVSSSTNERAAMEPVGSAQEEDENAPQAGIVGGIVAAVIAIIVIAAVIVVVVVVRFRRRKTTGDPNIERTQGLQNSGDEMYVNVRNDNSEEAATNAAVMAATTRSKANATPPSDNTRHHHQNARTNINDTRVVTREDTRGNTTHTNNISTNQPNTDHHYSRVSIIDVYECVTDVDCVTDLPDVTRTTETKFAENPPASLSAASRDQYAVVQKKKDKSESNGQSNDQYALVQKKKKKSESKDQYAAVQKKKKVKSESKIQSESQSTFVQEKKKEKSTPNDQSKKGNLKAQKRKRKEKLNREATYQNAATVSAGNHRPQNGESRSGEYSFAQPVGSTGSEYSEAGSAIRSRDRDPNSTPIYSEARNTVYEVPEDDDTKLNMEECSKLNNGDCSKSNSNGFPKLNNEYYSKLDDEEEYSRLDHENCVNPKQKENTNINPNDSAIYSMAASPSDSGYKNVKSDNRSHDSRSTTGMNHYDHVHLGDHDSYSSLQRDVVIRDVQRQAMADHYDHASSPWSLASSDVR